MEHEMPSRFAPIKHLCIYNETLIYCSRISRSIYMVHKQILFKLWPPHLSFFLRTTDENDKSNLHCNVKNCTYLAVLMKCI
jgi:hypothetical protein